MGSNTHNADPTVERIVAAWVAARGADGVPQFAPDEVARSAREMLAKGVIEEVLCAVVVVMAPKIWVDFRKYLVRWKPPAANQAGGTPRRPCNWCDKYGWYVTHDGQEMPCRHPEHPPLGYSVTVN